MCREPGVPRAERASLGPMEHRVEVEPNAATNPGRQRTYALLCAVLWFAISVAVSGESACWFSKWR